MFPTLTITLATNTDGLNELTADPAIWKDISDDSRPTPEQFFLNSGEFLLEAALGGERVGYFYLVPTGLGFLVHTIFGEKYRGTVALAAAKKAQRFAFEELGIEYLWSYVLDSNPKAGVFAQLSGFQKVGEREHAHTVEGVRVMCTFYERSKLRWSMEYA